MATVQRRVDVYPVIELSITAGLNFYVNVESIMTYPDLIPSHYFTLDLVCHHAT